MRFRGWFYAGGVALAVLHASFVAAQPRLEAPAPGMLCLLVNRNSGRCLSVAGGSVERGAKIVQGPMPEQAGASERWQLVGTNKGFRLRNHASRLVLEIGGANLAAGVQAIQWHDQVEAKHQHWRFEPVDTGYFLRAGHCDFVLGIAQASVDPGGPAVQWDYMPGILDQQWELRPAFQEYYWSFKSNPDKRDDFTSIGPAAADCVKFETAGLRIRLPLEHPAQAHTGIAKNLAVTGDFEITMGWQILDEPAPADIGQGTGLLLGVDLVAQRNRANFTRAVRERALFTTWFELTKEGADKPVRTEVKYFPTTARAGQFRLTRIGAELNYEFAEPASNDFTVLAQMPFSDEEVKQIRLAGLTGGPMKSLDARIIDLRIRAKTLPIDGVRAVADVQPIALRDDPAPARGRGWLAAMLLVSLTIVLLVGIALGAFLYLRQRGTAPMAAVPRNKH
jgi:hypothetical protein